MTRTADATRARSVVDGALMQVSPSSIQSYDTDTDGGCNRKWWFDKVARLEKPREVFQDVGTETHALIEQYLDTGDDCLNTIARAGKIFMPAPRVYLRLEHPGKLAPAGVPMVMYMDCVNESGVYVTPEGDAHEEDHVEIIDWKTTSDFRWAKTPSGLRSSVQMQSYGRWAFEHTDTADGHVRLSHVYFLTRGRPNAMKVTALIGRDENAEGWERIERLVRQMKVDAAAPRVEDVAPNRAACGAFKGCPYMAVCPRSESETFSLVDGLFQGSDENMSLLDSILKKSPAPSAAAPAETPAGTPGAVAAEVAALEAEERAAKGKPTPEEHAALVAKHVAETEARNAARRHVGVVPSDAPVSAPPTSAAPIPADALSTLPPEIAEAAKDWAPPPATTAPPGGTTTTSTSDAVTVVEEPRKRGRPPGSKNKPKVVDALEAAREHTEAAPTHPPGMVPYPSAARMSDAADMAAGSPDDTPGAVVEAVDATVAAAREVFAPAPTLNLYVDVLTDGLGALQSLEGYIAGVLASMVKAHPCADIRCAPDGSPYAFGKWKGALAALVRGNPPPAGSYLVTDVRESEIKAVVVETLRPLCAVYVRGR